MRLIWTCDNIDQLRSFSRFLEAKSIAFSIEEQLDKDWSSDQYGTKKFLLWIDDEDKVKEALEFLDLFLHSPDAPEFAAVQNFGAESVIEVPSPVAKYLENKLHRPIQEKERKLEGFVTTNFTTYLLLLCSLIFLLEFSNNKEVEKLPPESRSSLLAAAPVKKALLFDYPHSYEILDKIIALYGFDALTNPKTLPPAGLLLYDQYRKEPLWHGYYPYITAWGKARFTDKIVPTVPLEDIKTFEKIKQWQLWRIISPAFLHNDILHIVFNMIWLLILGSQIEARMKPWKYLLLISILAAPANLCQYLMTGPNFIGFSAVICGMATFIRTRQKTAPWEGYMLSSSTFAFISFFIGILAIFSFFTFLLDIFGNICFPIGIANTAHLVGAITGYALGRVNFFSWQN